MCSVSRSMRGLAVVCTAPQVGGKCTQLRPSFTPLSGDELIPPPPVSPAVIGVHSSASGSVCQSGAEVVSPVGAGLLAPD